MQTQGDVRLPVAADYMIYTLCTNVSGVLTATDATTKATYVLMRAAKSGEYVTAQALSEGGVICCQFAIDVNANVALYQAAGGKVSSSSASSALAFGQCVEKGGVNIVGSNGAIGRVTITR